MIYIFLRYKNKSALKLVLDFEYPSKFWGFRITYRLPVGLPLLRKRPIKNIVQIDYPRVSPGAHPLAKKHEDSGYEIALALDGNSLKETNGCLQWFLSGSIGETNCSQGRFPLAYKVSQHHVTLTLWNTCTFATSQVIL